jgi:hypothetical protein
MTNIGAILAEVVGTCFRARQTWSLSACGIFASMGVRPVSDRQPTPLRVDEDTRGPSASDCNRMDGL